MEKSFEDNLAVLKVCAEEIRGAIAPKSITPEMVGEAMLGIIAALGNLNDCDCTAVALRPEFSGVAPETLRDVVRKHLAGMRYAVKVKVSDWAQLETPGPSVVDPDLSAAPGGANNSGIAALSDEDGPITQADPDGESTDLSLGLTF